MARLSWLPVPTAPCPRPASTSFSSRQVNVPRIVVFLNKCDLVDDEEILDLVEMEMRELLSAYEYDGDNTPIIRGSALGAPQRRTRMGS